MEYFRNFKAKGQTNNYGGKKKKSNSSKCVLRGKSWKSKTITGNASEGFQEKTSSMLFLLCPPTLAQLLIQRHGKEQKLPCKPQLRPGGGAPRRSTRSQPHGQSPPLCIIVARVMFDPGVQHSDLTSLHALLCSPPARPPPAPARGSDNLANDIPGQCLCDCPVAYTPGEAERGGQGCWRPAATSQTAPPASRQPLVLVPRKGHPPGV